MLAIHEVEIETLTKRGREEVEVWQSLLIPLIPLKLLKTRRRLVLVFN